MTQVDYLNPVFGQSKNNQIEVVFLRVLPTVENPYH